MNLLFKILWPYVLVLVLAMSVSWYVWSPKPAPPEIYAPEIKQSDGSIIMEKTPNASVKPTFKVPKGATVERVIKFAVQAKTPVSNTDGQSGTTEKVTLSDSTKKAAVVCPPVNVELALVRNSDETKSVIARADNGEIIGAVDIPVEAAKPIVKPKLWAIGAVANPAKETYGAFVDRDFGWLRTGLQLNQIESRTLPSQYWVKAGIRF